MCRSTRSQSQHTAVLGIKLLLDAVHHRPYYSQTYVPVSSIFDPPLYSTTVTYFVPNQPLDGTQSTRPPTMSSTADNPAAEDVGTEVAHDLLLGGEKKLRIVSLSSISLVNLSTSAA